MFSIFKQYPRLQSLERLCFFAIILFLPTQLGKHFWPDFSIVEGLRIDYLSPTIYLTDILIGLLFVLYFLRSIFHHRWKISNLKFQISNFKKRKYWLLVVLVCIGSINIYLSHSPIAGLYKLGKVMEMIFLGFYVAKNVEGKKDFLSLLAVLATGVIFESLLGIAQYFHGASLGGVFWFFGERTFSGQTPGVAQANIDGRLLLRSYATFPHPNVLAGYLTIAMAMVISNLPVRQAGLKSQISNFKKILFIAAILLGTIALFLSLSRVAILLWVLVASYWFLVKLFDTLKNKRYFIFYISFFIFAIMILIALTPLSPRFTSLTNVDQESFVYRQELNTAALAMVNRSPLFGVGLNNFLIQLPQFQRAKTTGFLWLQPVHNIYLLIGAETGIVGLLFSLWFVMRTYKRIMKKPSILLDCRLLSLSLILALGLFDHYFLTLQQGQLLTSLVFGIAWARKGT